MDNKCYTQTLHYLNRQIHYIKNNGFPGLCNEFAEIVGKDSGLNWLGYHSDTIDPDSIPKDNGLVGEELTIKLPFAGTNLTIRLLFHLHEPWMPPDLIFSDQNFMDKIVLKDIEEQVPSLDNWNPYADDIIAQLLLQLHHLYKNYQLERLEEDEEVLQFEYQSLLKVLKIGEEDVEILVSGPMGNWTPASLLVRLPLSLQDVPPILIDVNPGPAVTLLHVNVQRKDCSFTPRLYLSPPVEALIGGASTLALPHVPPGTSLMDYVTRILELLEEKVKSAVTCFEKRKQYIAQILCQFGSALIEYDAEKFSKIVLMLSWNDFNFLLIIKLPHFFPQDPPTLTMQSLYHSVNRQPLKKEVIDLTFSSAWSPEDMVKHTKEAVLKYVQTFQSISVKLSSH